jgi:hypothetical protein
VIVSLHVATGAGAGLLARSRTAALLLGVPLHLAEDRVPHQDIASRPFEVSSGLACVGLLALRRGLFDPVTLGAASTSAPDLEHLFPWLRPRGRKLFHRGGGGHGRSRALPANAQLLAAGAILGTQLSLRATRSGR